MRVWLGLSIFCCAIAGLRAETSVEIDLEEQMAYLLQNGRPVLASPISSGCYGHLTRNGSFKILEKERTHYSSMYGKIVDARGNTIVADADADMSVPRGGKFIPAPMHYFMRFCGADGMHAGYLPGYPASHGCVRMPQEYAIAFLMPSTLERQSHCSAGRQLEAMHDSGNPHSCEAATDLQNRDSIPGLRHPRRSLGGGNIARSSLAVVVRLCSAHRSLIRTESSAETSSFAKAPADEAEATASSAQ